MNNQAEQAQQLLEKIHFYYPIGMASMETSYRGYDFYKELLEKKINGLINNTDTPWTSFIKLLDEYEGLNILDCGFQQFPSYTVKLEMKKTTGEAFDYQRSLVVNISLLTEHFTLFFEDHYLYKNFTDGFRNPTFKIAFSKSTIEESQLADLIKRVCEDLAKLFPAHKFIYHKTLFLYKIKDGHLYTIGETPSDTNLFLYHYLFDGFYDTNNLNVCE